MLCDIASYRCSAGVARAPHRLQSFRASSSRLSGSVARLLAVERTLPHCHSGKYDDNDVSFDNSLHHHEGGQATVKGVEKVLNADDNW